MMRIYVLTNDSRSVRLIKNRLQGLCEQAGYTLELKTANDEDINDEDSPSVIIDRLTSNKGPHDFFFLHHGDIFGIFGDAGKVTDRVYTFHHERDDEIYQRLFRNKYSSIHEFLADL